MPRGEVNDRRHDAVKLGGGRGGGISAGNVKSIMVKALGVSTDLASLRALDPLTRAPLLSITLDKHSVHLDKEKRL